jgi:uroporphyrinogen decarboxylase
MNHRERFHALLRGDPIDRVPLYFFGTWRETKLRWRNEGLGTITNLTADAGPQVPGMDPDWEEGMWNCYGLVHAYLIGDQEVEILSEDHDFVLKRNEFGDVIRESKLGRSTPELVEPSLKPTRASWRRFSMFLDPGDARRNHVGWQNEARELQGSDRVLAFMGGSLYGWLRNWMGVEALSFLLYDDPVLLEDMVSHITDFFMKVMAPILSTLRFDLVYFFEDCCGANGPLFSPDTYRRIFDRYYRKLITFYKENGVIWALIDSDGNVERLVPAWVESGFDILFPLEAGKWGTTPSSIRRVMSKQVKIMGAVDKHVISRGEEAIRRHLLALKHEVDQGGFLPLPDHRIPPEVSYKDMLTYIRVFREEFDHPSDRVSCE